MKTKLLAMMVGLGISLISHAQPVAGEYHYSFTNGLIPLHDLSVSVVTNVDGIDEQITLNLSPKGRLTGSFTAHYDDGTVVLDLNGSLAGSLSSTPPRYQMVFAGHGPLSGTAYGRPIRGTHTFRARLEADPITGVATGRETVTVCLVGYGCRTESEDLSFNVIEPANSEGDWSLVLNISTKRNTISGTAQAMLANGRTAEFRVLGTYAPRSQTTRLTLRGTGAANGVLINLTADSAMQLRSVRGKLFGQPLDKTLDANP
jgi:hypothetical protein